ncbi:hypothetical protein LTR95_004344 [Oleoguttula sp. CCFEE 5521]
MNDTEREGPTVQALPSTTSTIKELYSLMPQSSNDYAPLLHEFLLVLMRLRSFLEPLEATSVLAQQQSIPAVLVEHLDVTPSDDKETDSLEDIHHVRPEAPGHSRDTSISKQQDRSENSEDAQQHVSDQPAPASRLLQLPPELRLMIYDFVFAATRSQDHRLNKRACYPLPPLLRVCALVRNEGLATWRGGLDRTAKQEKRQLFKHYRISSEMSIIWQRLGGMSVFPRDNKFTV